MYTLNLTFIDAFMQQKLDSHRHIHKSKTWQLNLSKIPLLLPGCNKKQSSFCQVVIKNLQNSHSVPHITGSQLLCTRAAMKNFNGGVKYACESRSGMLECVIMLVVSFNISDTPIWGHFRNCSYICFSTVQFF